MSTRSPITYKNIFDAKGTTGTTVPYRIGSFRNQVFAVYGAGSITGTLKVKVSGQEAMPDFTAAISATNMWNYADIALSDNAGAVTDGDTGVTFSGTAGCRHFEINQNSYTWCALEIPSISGLGAAVTAHLTLTNNQ